MQKQLKGTQKYINYRDRAAHIDGHHAILHNKVALPAEYKCLK